MVARRVYSMSQRATNGRPYKTNLRCFIIECIKNPLCKGDSLFSDIPHIRLFHRR